MKKQLKGMKQLTMIHLISESIVKNMKYVIKSRHFVVHRCIIVKPVMLLSFDAHWCIIVKHFFFFSLFDAAAFITILDFSTMFFILI